MIIKKSSLKPENKIDPDLMDYAYNIFPSLNEVSPRSNIQIPMAPEEELPPADQEEATPEATPEVAPKVDAEPEKEVEIPETEDTEPSRSPAVQEEEEQPVEQDNTKLVEEMQANQRRARMAESMARTRDAIIGAGLGRKFETDYGMYKELKEEATEPIQKIKIIQELDNQAAKNSPNSQISKLVRGTLADLGVNMKGMDKVSYSQIEKLYPSVVNSMMNKLLAETRKEEAALNRQIRADAQVKAAEDKEKAREIAAYEKTRAIVNNKISKLQDGRLSPFLTYEKAKQNYQSLDNAIRSWDNEDREAKIIISQGFMEYAKLAQGDDSVVRSSDMQALAGSLNFGSVPSLLEKFWARSKGAPFSKGELEQMKKVVDTIRKVKKRQLQQRLDPIILDAKRGGYDLDQSISPEIVDEIYAEEPMTVEEKARRLKELKAKQNQGK